MTEQQTAKTVVVRAQQPTRPPRAFVPKRGRPTAEQVQAIEDTILSTAKKLFLDHGYASTSMEAVALETGVSKGTLYARYRTKAELFEAIVTERLRAWDETLRLPEPAMSSDAPEQLFRAAVEFLHGIRVPEVGAFDRLILAEGQRFPELARRFHEQGFDRAVAQLANNLEQSARQSGWPLSDAEGVARLFYCGLLGWYRNAAVLDLVTEEQCATEARKLVALFVGGRSAW